MIIFHVIEPLASSACNIKTKDAFPAGSIIITAIDADQSLFRQNDLEWLGRRFE